MPVHHTAAVTEAADAVQLLPLALDAQMLAAGRENSRQDQEGAMQAVDGKRRFLVQTLTQLMTRARGRTAAG